MREQLGATDDADTGLVAGRLDAEYEGFTHRAIVSGNCCADSDGHVQTVPSARQP